MDDFSLRPTRLARSFSSGKVVRPEEETGGFSPRPIRLSRSSPDLGKTFPDKEEYLEKKITFLEEFKSATSFAGLLRTPLCIPNDEPFTNTNYEGYFGDGDYDDLEKKIAFLEEKITVLEEFKRAATRYDHDDPYEGCYDDDDPYEGCYDDDDPYEGCYDDDDPYVDDDYDDPYEACYDYDDPNEACYDYDDYDDIFSNTISNRSDDGTSSPDRLHVPSDLEAMLQDKSSRPHDIPLRDLKEITNNFSDDRILGEGGSCVVYKGVLQNGEMVAVKKIVPSLMPGPQKQFQNEVCHVMILKHPNIVRCVGYCYETRNACLEHNGKHVFAEVAERLLCLEYLPKGSLDKYISDESSGLDWSTRYNIIKGICYGLCHLHEQTIDSIIHLDLKPANILLDDGMVPKITDFGLSRQLRQQTIKTSSRDGTFGYMPPELFHGGTITRKSDIFSLGVIIVEVITGDKPDITGKSSDEIIELTLKKWRNVLHGSPAHGSVELDCEQIKRCIQVGLICVNHDHTKRPSITKVINMLQGSESIDCHIINKTT